MFGGGFEIQYTQDDPYLDIKKTGELVQKLNGTSVAKTEEQAKVIAEEAIKLIDHLAPKVELPLVCNVGVVGNIIKELIDKDVQIIGTDFDDTVVDNKLFGEVEVVHGNNNPDIIKKSDVAVITGMTQLEVTRLNLKLPSTHIV